MELVNVVPSDLGWIDLILDRWVCSSRWSMKDRTPSPAQLDDALWGDVVLQQTARAPDGAPFALFQVAHADLSNGVADLGFLVDPTELPRARSAMATFVERVFIDLRLRKLCFAVVDDGVPIDEMVGSETLQVGHHSRHVRRGESTYVDVRVFEVWKPEPS